VALPPSCDRFPNSVDIVAAPAVIDPYIAPLDPAQLRQRLHENGDASLRTLIISDARECADAPHRLALLKLRCLTVEIRECEIEALVQRGLLNQETRNDTAAITDALHSFMDQTLN
jgi:hypothetical protein